MFITYGFRASTHSHGIGGSTIREARRHGPWTAVECIHQSSSPHLGTSRTEAYVEPSTIQSLTITCASQELEVAIGDDDEGWKCKGRVVGKVTASNEERSLQDGHGRKIGLGSTYQLVDQVVPCIVIPNVVMGRSLNVSMMVEKELVEELMAVLRSIRPQEHSLLMDYGLLGGVYVGANCVWHAELV